MQVPFVLRFYHPDKKDKIGRFIHSLGSKMALKLLPLAVFSLFEVKKRCGSCIQSIRFWIWSKNSPHLWIIISILVKKRTIRFWIKNPDLDFSKETHP